MRFFDDCVIPQNKKRKVLGGLMLIAMLCLFVGLAFGYQMGGENTYDVMSAWIVDNCWQFG